MNPALSALIALQQLDTAAEDARRRLTELPAEEEAIAARLAAADEAVAAAEARLADNQASRRELEKQVAVVDGRLAKFDEHKAAVKTNQEYTALLHEIDIARGEKDRLEEQILVLMEQADILSAEIREAKDGHAAAGREGDTTRARLGQERVALEAEIERLASVRAKQTAEVDVAVLARYEQLLKQRRMVAVAPMTGDTCAACHVRLRPAVTQQVRRNTDIVHCDSCQRILFFEQPAPTTASRTSP